jgi:hypothetical protein
MQAMGFDLSGGGALASSTQGVGGFPWLATGVLMALGIGGTMLLSQAKIVKLPRWAPAFLKG